MLAPLSGRAGPAKGARATGYQIRPASLTNHLPGILCAAQADALSSSWPHGQPLSAVTIPGRETSLVMTDASAQMWQEAEFAWS